MPHAEPPSLRSNPSDPIVDRDQSPPVNGTESTNGMDRAPSSNLPTPRCVAITALMAGTPTTATNPSVASSSSQFGRMVMAGADPTAAVACSNTLDEAEPDEPSDGAGESRACSRHPVALPDARSTFVLVDAAPEARGGTTPPSAKADGKGNIAGSSSEPVGSVGVGALDNSVRWLVMRTKDALRESDPEAVSSSAITALEDVGGDDARHRRLTLLVPAFQLAASVVEAVGVVGEATAARLADGHIGRGLQPAHHAIDRIIPTDMPFDEPLYAGPTALRFGAGTDDRSSIHELASHPLEYQLSSVALLRQRQRADDQLLLSDYSPLWQTFVHHIGSYLRAGTVELRVNDQVCRSASHAFDVVIEALTREPTHAEHAAATAHVWAADTLAAGRSAWKSLERVVSPGVSAGQDPDSSDSDWTELSGTRTSPPTDSCEAPPPAPARTAAARATPETLTKLARLAVLLCHPAAFLVPFDALKSYSEGTMAGPDGLASGGEDLFCGRTQRTEIFCGSHPRRLLVRGSRPVEVEQRLNSSTVSAADKVIATVSFDVHLISAEVETALLHEQRHPPTVVDPPSQRLARLEEMATIEWDLALAE